MANSKSGKKDDSVPFYDGSYYRIVTRVFEAAKGATREAKALGTHTKKRFSALGLVAKVLVAVLLVGLGAAAAVGAYLLMSPNEARLREHVRAQLAAGELVKAQASLERLRGVVGGLSAADRRGLADPLRAKLEQQAKKLRRDIEASARAGAYDQARAGLDALEELGTDAPYVLFTRGDVLRAAKKPEATDAYARFIELYPDSDKADDAMFWQALMAKEEGDAAHATAVLEDLLERFPQSNFARSSKSLLAELKGQPK